MRTPLLITIGLILAGLALIAASFAAPSPAPDRLTEPAPGRERAEPAEPPASGAESEVDAAAESVRFVPLAVYVDAGDHRLAAYQIELTAEDDRIRFVGVEGNADLPFRNPPYYDPEAMTSERLILAAFTTDEPAELPTGRTRVATVHLRVPADGEPALDARLTTAADPAGDPVDASVHLSRTTSQPGSQP